MTKRKKAVKDVDISDQEEEKVMSDGSENNDMDVIVVSENKKESLVNGKRKSEPKSKPHKLKKSELYKPPTVEELNTLKEAQNLFQSNLFRMQISELLEEIKLKEKWCHSLEAWMESFKKELCAIPEVSTVDLSDLSWRKKCKVQVPIIQEPPCTKGVFHFLPPSKVVFVGSYATGLAYVPHTVVDIAIEIPKECLQHKDYLNHCYLRKRAFYLAHVTEHLKKSSLVEDVWYSYHHDDHTKPILMLRPAGNVGKHFTISLMPMIPTNFFKPVRFTPSKNNVRSSWFYKNNEFEDKPTPHYNASILTDMVLEQHTQFLKEKISEAQELKNGILLLKIWLHQRNLDEGKAGFTGFMMAMFVIYLLKRHKISTLMSSYQVMRNTLLALTQLNLSGEGITLCQQDQAEMPSLSEFHRGYDTVFVDHTGWMNLCANVSKEVFERLKHEADLSMKFMDTLQSGSFDALFMKPVPFYRKFDHILHFSPVDKLIQAAVEMNLEDKFVDSFGDVLSVVLPEITRILRNALGKRIHLLGVKQWSLGKWSVTSSPPDPNHIDRVTLGLLLNTEVANSAIERGPHADSPEAKDFREFWGPISELRRFQDGSICEAVLWKANSLADKRVVVEQIIKYALNRHAKISNCLEFVHNQLEAVLLLPDVKLGNNDAPYGTGEEANISLMQSFGELTKRLRKISDLPLPVASVQGISPAFRFAEVFSPLPAHSFSTSKTLCIKENCLTMKEKETNAAPPWVQPLKVVVHLESSGKWPEDVQALRRVKAAFHLKMAELLHSNFSLTCLPRPEYVEVFQDGYVFCVEVACHKEITLLKQVTTPEGMQKTVETDEAKDLEYRTETLPKLTGIIHGIQQQHNTFSTACRMTKRWLSSQLLLRHLPEEVVEILVAYVYLVPAPFSTPGSPQVAFLRFLSLVATHDWATAPLIVPLCKESKNEEVAEIHSTFTTQRPTLPPMFVSTPLDKVPSMWTRQAPTPPILHRLVMLARAALDTSNQQFNSPKSQDFKLLFRPPLDSYDVIIRLKLVQVPTRHMAVDFDHSFNPPKYVAGSEELAMPIVGHDPVQLYLNEIQESYGEFALFFHDNYGGDIIGVIWKPQAFKPQPFKVSHINGRMLTEMTAAGGSTMIPNVEAIIEGFGILGSGLVNSIETKTERWIIE